MLVNVEHRYDSHPGRGSDTPTAAPYAARDLRRWCQDGDVTATPELPDTTDEVASLQPVSELPGPIRHRIVEWAAETLTGLTPRRDAHGH